MAKSYAGESAVAIAGKAMQLHGGIGYTWESGIHVYLETRDAQPLAVRLTRRTPPTALELEEILVRDVGDQATVHHELRTGGERRLVAGEEHDEGRHFLGLPGPAQR